MILASMLILTAGALSVEIPAPIVTAPNRVAFVDLGKPGAMESLAEANPTHYTLVRQAMEAARYVGCDGAARMHKANGEEGRIACTDAMLMTSYPARKRISVQLGSTTYTATVTVERKPSP